MHNLSDRDIAYDLLYGCKSTSQLYMQAVLESASPRCREVFHRIHDDGLRSQWKIWRFLHNRNEYRTDPADRREIEGVRQRMEHLCQTHQDAVRPQFAMAGAREGEGARWDERDNRWGESGQAPYGGGMRSGTGYGTAPNGGTGAYGPAGYSAGVNASTGGAYGQGGYASGGAAGYASGTSTGGTYGAGINFEAGRNLPDGTRFEAERGFAEGYDGGRRQAAGGNAWGETGYSGGGDRSRYGAGTSAGRWNTGAGRAETQGSNWNERQDRDAPTGVGARPADGGRRGAGENNWAAETTRRSPASAQRY